MKTMLKTVLVASRLLLFGLLVFGLEIDSNATISLPLNSAVTENFNSLANSGTGLTWTDNSTIPGWYSSRTSYNASTGTGTSGNLYSYGVAGVNAVTDRALGSLASGGASGSGTIYYGAAFQVVSTTTSLLIKYDGEQWRRGENANTLTFAYFLGDPTSIGSSQLGWTTVANLNFTGPQVGTGAALDGNAAANRSANITFTITGLNIAGGNDLWIRWSDPDSTGNDAGLGIDNFSITAVPEASTWVAGLGLSLGMLGSFVRKYRK